MHEFGLAYSLVSVVCAVLGSIVINFCSHKPETLPIPTFKNIVKMFWEFSKLGNTLIGIAIIFYFFAKISFEIGGK